MKKAILFFLCSLFLFACENPLEKQKREQLQLIEQEKQRAENILRQAEQEAPKTNQDSNLNLKNSIIETAEQFVRIQGYTDAEIDRNDEFELVRESLEASDEEDEILNFRYNTLKAKAVGGQNLGGIWQVGFEYVDAKDPEFGRVVQLSRSEDQKEWEIKMVHQDFKISLLK